MLRRLTIGLIAACAGVVPAVAEAPPPLQPYQMVRSLQLLQDRLASGDHAALPLQKKLLELIDKRLRESEDAVFEEKRNVRAALVYGMSGGNPLTLSAVFHKPTISEDDKRLGQGVLNYLQGNPAAAQNALANVDPRAMPSEIGAFLALVKGSVTSVSDPTSALKQFDTARLLGPGTLVEEAALRRSLAGPLPGTEAQSLMGRTPREMRTLPFDHHGAVLLLLYPHPADPRPHVVLTLRSDNLRRHRGQVSFPGGLVEPGEDFAAAALREAQEEVGIEPSRVELLGALTPLPMPHTGFVLHPFVGVAPARPDLRPCEDEVARVLEVPLRLLADPGRVMSEPRLLGERLYQVPYFDVEGEKVWGSTAMILAELLSILGAPPRAHPWEPAPLP